jgi:exonuclease SbcC
VALAEERRLQGRHERGQLVAELESATTGESARLSALQEESRELDEQRAAMKALEERQGAIRAELALLGDPRRRQSEHLALAARQSKLEANLTHEVKRRDEEEAMYRRFSEELLPFETLDEEIAIQHEIQATHRPAYEAYLQNGAEAALVSEREEAAQEAVRAVQAAHAKHASIAAAREATAKLYSAEEHADLQVECRDVSDRLAAQRAVLQQAQHELRIQEVELERLLRQQDKLKERLAERGELGRVTNAMAFIRETIKSAGPAVTETLLAHISQGANDIFSEIMDDHTVELRWDRDYEVLAQRGAEIRKFNQLSGGEQMSAALAVRLALLKEMSEVDFAFFDEPTQNMDGERRTNLANQIGEIRGFDQLIVISHDDTFEHHTENLIRLAKIHEETQLETS